MKKIIVSFGTVLLATLVLTGCGLIPAGEVKTDTLDYKIDRLNPQSNQNPVMMNVNLPVEKLIIVSGQNRHEFEVEIASNESQRKVGLMNRKNLDENKGMLFVFDFQGYLNFWMKNTLIPLDMLFIDEKGYVRYIIRKAQPCLSGNDADCAIYNSEEPAKYVLEINGGIADKLGIKPGDKASWL